jgi:predicted Fe-Mo cluster-binding NifX family protein
MRIALPVANGLLNLHFGHCEKFALVDVDSQTKKITKEDTIEAPLMSRDFSPAGSPNAG